jgi:hypothetical protein
MRNELNEVREIDRYLHRQLTDAEARSFEARVCIHEALAEKLEAQRIAHRIIRLYGRARERRRLQQIYRQLMEEQIFGRQITTIFI